jgi:RNA polymerase sigma-70 factor (ECF subfamily)
MELDAVVSERERVVPASFDDVFHELFPRVARTAALVARDPQLGPDIAQEAFARLYERWDRMASLEHARNFVFRVAVNLARSQLRRRVAAPFGLAGPERADRDDTARSDDWLIVAEALTALSPKQRAAVVLVDYADLDAAAASQVLGTAEATVRVHLMRGRRALRERLGPSPEEDDR